MAVNTFGKSTKRQLLENALAQSQEVSKIAQNPQNFGGGYAGAFGAIAQGLTAGIGAYAEYKQRQQLAQLEADDIAKFSQFATEKGDTDLASIAEQLTPETRQAYYMQKTMPELMGGGAGDVSKKIQEYNFYKSLPSKEDRDTFMYLQRNIGGEGSVLTDTGELQPLRGYGVAGARRKGMEQTAQNVSDLTYKPQISKETTKQEAVGKKEGAIAVKEITAPETDAIIQEIKTILPKSTSGIFQAGVSKSASMVGISTDMDKADRQLQILGGKLLMGADRFEGTQSNYDVGIYKQLAGDVANTNIPYKSRLSALKQLEELNNKFLKTPSPKSAPQKKQPTQGIKFLGFE